MSSNDIEFKCEEDSNQKFFGFTKRQLIFLIIFGIANILRASSIFIIGPYYPPVAESKNVTQTYIGFVISSFDFTTFLTTLLYGIVLIKILGPQLVFILSCVCTGIATILLGLVALVDNQNTFIALSFAIRILAGFGDAGCYPSIFVIIALEFKNSIALTIGILELFFGIGGIVGPIVAGALIDVKFTNSNLSNLYSEWDFTVAYVLIGSLILLGAFINYLILPSFKTKPQVIPLPLKKLLTILAIPEIILAIFHLIFTATSIGFLFSTLESHLEKFDLSSLQTGLVFTLGNGVYMIFSAGWGYFYDNVQKFKHIVSILGGLFIIVGFSFVGPLPFINAEVELWSIYVGVILHAIGIGASVMTTFPRVLSAATDRGFSNTLTTQSLISSIFTMTFTLGNTIGPSVGGVLYDNIGFRWGTLFIIGFGILMMLAEILHYSMTMNKKPIS